MRKIRNLIGMPVIVNSKRAGRIVQVELSEDLAQLKGIWMDSGFRGTRFIPSESVAMIGKIAVVADDAGKRMPLKCESLFRRAVCTDGRRIGAITGAEIDELSFRVEALELSRGLWDDLLGGRSRLRRFTVNRNNGDVLIDAAETEKEDDHEERYDEGPDHRRADRRFCSSHVRRDELADCQKDEPADEEDRPLDLSQG